MFGNGSSGFKVIGFGTSGQFLTSGGAGSAPSWSTASIDQAGNYIWTGGHIFTSSSTVTSTLNLDGTTNLGGTINITSPIKACATGFGEKTQGATGAEVIVHGLGSTPSYVSIDATRSVTGNPITHSFGTATSTNVLSQSTNSWTISRTLDAFDSHGTSTIIFLTGMSTSDIYTSATITGLTPTTFTITWGTNHALYSKTRYIWTVCK
jgi:hypothetical protein